MGDKSIEKQFSSGTGWPSPLSDGSQNKYLMLYLNLITKEEKL